MVAMTVRTYDEAVDHALAQAMAADDRILTWGEDLELIRRDLLAQFGPERVRDTPISESAFLYAGVGAAMAGLKPVVELYMVDFAAVAWSALVNAAGKFTDFSGGSWPVPLVVRAGYGGWYGDGGQHEQALWGALATCPSTAVVVPSTPADAAGLMLAALEGDGFTIVLTPKLLDRQLLDYLGGTSRSTVDLEGVVPPDAARGEVPEPVTALPFGQAVLRRDGADVLLVSVGVGVHRCLEAAQVLAESGVDASVLDLRTVTPLDREALAEHAARTGRVVVADEDYAWGGLAGEVAAVLLEHGAPVSYARVAVEQTIPYAPHLEHAALPNARRIVEAVRRLEQASPIRRR
jgi:pyruvate dehydrogenase E1 component beta subunit